MTEADYAIDHELRDEDEHIHNDWDKSLEPVRTIEPGEVVRFECRDATDGQLDPESTAEDVAEVDVGRVHALTGPVAIDGTRPGDVIEVELLDIEHEGWGYTAHLPGAADLGVLAEEFPDPGIHIWELDGDVGHFVNGIEVPLDPFPGIVGVAPAEDGEHDTLPPRSVGGNMDVKHLTVGSTLSLPVAVDGGLLSVGDCHAAQGDGEVCGTGIEAPMTVTCRVDVRSDATIEQPQFETDHPFTPTGGDESMYGTMGIDADPETAATKAVRYMVEHLHEERGLTRSEAYILCSAAVDLKFNQAVTPNKIISAYLPESIFPSDHRR